MEYTRKNFQIEDLEFFRERKSSANFSEMGCMKTSTVQFLMQDLGVERVLIVTSRTGKVAYYETVPSILPDMELVDPKGRSEVKLPTGPFVLLTNYAQWTKASPLAKQLRKYKKLDMIVLDESHRIKNRNAQASQHLWYMKAPIRHVMSGTPYVNDPAEIWSQAKFLDRDIGGYWNFRGHFCEIEETFSGYEHVTGVNPDTKDEFKSWIYSWARRRTKAEVFPELPEKLLYPAITVELNGTQKRMYNEVLRELATLDAQGTPLSAANVVAGFTRLRQIATATPEVISRVWNERQERYEYNIRLTEPSSKLDALMDRLEDVSSQVVVFTQFKDVVELAANRLKSRCIVMRQKDSDRIRAQKVSDFQRGNAQVFLCTLDLGSESITLTAADTVVFLDRSWSPRANLQAEDRVHRPGQDQVTCIQHIEARGTIDGYVKHKVGVKTGWFKEIFQTTPSRAVFHGIRV